MRWLVKQVVWFVQVVRRSMTRPDHSADRSGPQKSPDPSSPDYWRRVVFKTVVIILRGLILRPESAGLPLTPGGHGGVGSPLYQAASRIFGSWRNAVVAAGTPPRLR